MRSWWRKTSVRFSRNATRLSIIVLTEEVQSKQRGAGQAGLKSKRTGAETRSANTRLKPTKSGVGFNDFNAMHPLKSK